MKKLFKKLFSAGCALALALTAAAPAAAYSGGPGMEESSGRIYSGGPGMEESSGRIYSTAVYSGGPGAVRLAQGGVPSPAEELRGVWIAYLTWDRLPDDWYAFQKEVDQMLDNCRSWGMNAVFVHARSHSDATYASAIYPWSKFVSGTQGKNPGYDPFQYMVQAAHQRGLQIHAWVNPYRITGYLMPWEDVSSSNPAKKWLADGDSSNDRYVLKHDGDYYFNPSAEPVKQMVVNGVMELVRNYDIDGIHFDDYFYPELDDSVEARQFDRPEYLASGSRLSIAQWRRDNVSDLVRRVYQAIKAEKPQVQFGVSPQGYVEHLRSGSKLFVDIDRWMSEAGFIDYIMPQLYWGFETKTSSGAPAPYAFGANLNTWINLKKKGNVKLYLGLGMYRAGTQVQDYNEVSEWLRRDDIISRQVTAGRQSGQVSGYCFYSYESFLEETSRKEAANLLAVFR